MTTTPGPWNFTEAQRLQFREAHATETERRLAARECLPSLPQYTCGQCGETFGTNFTEDEIECAYCSARRCPHCHEWFGGES
jgi:hypothetical protein